MPYMVFVTATEDSENMNDPPALARLFECGAVGICVTRFGGGDGGAPGGGVGVVRLGVHAGGVLPEEGLERFDVLLSVAPDAPAPWVSARPEDLAGKVAALRLAVERQPVAAGVAAQVFRMTLSLGFANALVLESLAYSMLLASEGFAAWRAARPVRRRKDAAGPRVDVSRDDGKYRVRLARPAARNAVDARMRDGLVEALEAVLLDAEGGAVELSGEGPVFCAGGDLDEFGQADDAGRAHAIRSLQSPVRLVEALGARVTARVHGACIGAGIEIPAAAARVIAQPGTFFRLPEVAMGLIPGAGGTASIARRIGRHRACYMALSGADIDTETALAWGLIDSVAI
jgi:hypothetical protein